MGLKNHKSRPMRPSKKRLLDAAETLVSQLNLPKRTLRRSGVDQVRQLLLQLTEMRYEVARSLQGEGLSQKEMKRRDAEFERKQKRFNTLFASLGPHTRYLQLQGFDADGRPIFYDVTPVDGNVYLAELTRAGWIDRLRLCAYCGVWFLAGKPWATFHSSKCKKAAARLTDEFQEKNKKYQREYYRENLSKPEYQDLYLKGCSPAEVRQVLRDRKRNRRSMR